MHFCCCFELIVLGAGGSFAYISYGFLDNHDWKFPTGANFQNLNIFYFSSNSNAGFCKMIIVLGLLMTYKKYLAILFRKGI
jgi:hypothetical protein